MLELIRETHSYVKDGVKVGLPSITEIIKAYGKDYSGISGFYTERGIAVHAGVALINAGTLDWSTVDAAVAPYLQSYEKFLDKTSYQPFEWETPLESQKHAFVGTFDLVCKKDEKLILMDIKTSRSIDPVIELQLSGQLILYSENRSKLINECGALQLMQDGSQASYKPRDPGPFLAALEMYHWKKSHTRK